MALRIRLQYRLRNDFGDAALVMLALPPSTSSQRIVAISVNGVKEPDVQGKIVTLNLYPGEEYRLDASIELCAQPDAAENAQSATRWLVESPLVRLSDDLKQIVREIEATYTSPEERARRAFEIVVQEMRYVWPPPRRGAAASYEMRRGDCGEYTWMFVGLCRAMDIPARSVCGTFIYGGLAPHVWAEIFLPDRGWVAVDPSLTALRRTNARNPIGMIRALVSMSTTRPHSNLWPLTLFDFSARDRVAFSLGEDHAIPPEASSLLRDQSAIDEKFRWGKDSFGGKIPFLQPASALGISTKNIFVDWNTSNATFGGAQRATSLARAVLLLAFVALSVAGSLTGIPLHYQISTAFAAILGICICTRLFMRTVDIIDIGCAALLVLMYR